MPTYLFKIKPVDRAHAERALASVDCWLERNVVTCSGQEAHRAAEMTRSAEQALENYRVYVYE